MGLMDSISQKIKEEIANDPVQVGYAGKTDAEIALILNSPVRRIVMTEIQEQPPINRILSGIPQTANQVTVSDVTAAKATVDVVEESK